MRRDLVRRVEALEEDANPGIATWLDLVLAADAPPGTTFTVSPEMAELFDSCREETDHEA